MTVDLCIKYIIMLILIPMLLTLMQGHSWSAKAQIQCRIISITKKATSVMKLAETVDQFLCVTLTLQTLYALTTLLIIISGSAARDKRDPINYQ